MINLKKFKSKIEDLFDDMIYHLRNIKYETKSFLEFLSRWFSYYKVLREAYDFDYDSILRVEYHQISRVRDCILRCQHHVDYENDIRYMNLALKLLDIILENGCSELVGKGFYIEGNEIKSDPENKWVIPVYVNTKNAKRFISDGAIEFLSNPRTRELTMDDLRIEKAWNLYHKLRVYNMRSWWD